ncbi:hypothetical protein B0H10DRAFT_2444125 [Mycena sp. CBHHK59/15]|nr:hypothetical protein B0H10DRAFT_2444125 [Mycena sp. CBHHK59/15]
MRSRGTSRSAQPFVAGLSPFLLLDSLPSLTALHGEAAVDHGRSHRRCFLVRPPSCTPVPTDADADALEDYTMYAPLLLTPSPSSCTFPAPPFVYPMRLTPKYATAVSTWAALTFWYRSIRVMVDDLLACSNGKLQLKEYPPRGSRLLPPHYYLNLCSVEVTAA